MFRTLIYFDNKKITEYKSLIEGKKAISLNNVKISSEKIGKAQIPVLSGEFTGRSEMNGEILSNYLLDCAEFENLLKDRDDYYDFTKNDNFDIETISRSSIIHFNAIFEIPPEFDMLDLINQFKPILIRSVDTNSKDESDLLNSLLGKDSTKIPIFIENDQVLSNRLGFSKINSNYLHCDMANLEDFENQDVTIIAKLLFRRDIQSEPVVVYDVMKDLFGIGRAIRRQLGNNKIDGINNISINEDFITLEILAIYQ
ncbi:hypothetical protein [Tissierella sp.]|uniref:hypothetical protein n=1 Tax=Tissierella sp. TaxID=41274 RepID=UPI0028656EC6|nr:hypothetical protein [Tissierella sp.]MDR7856648.1 hypothetical protein [Tissierella sp.]